MKIAIARKSETKIEKDIDTEVKKVQKDFEEAKKSGKNYLERYITLMEKEKKAFVAIRAKIEASMAQLRDDPQIIRQDLLLRSLNKLKLNGTVAGPNTVKFLGGKMVRKFEGAVYKCESKDDALCAKILKEYGKFQYDQDEKKLEAITVYFDRSITALKLAIDVRDGKAPLKDKPIQLGAYKLGDAGIKTFSLLPGVTCPGKGECFNWCFALSGHTNMPNVGIKSYAKNLGAAERDDFEDRVNKQLKSMQNRSQGEVNFNGKHFKNIVRIHAYGDFHTTNYVEKWKRIAKNNPDTFFYAYTKSFFMKPVQKWMEAIAKGKVQNVKIIQSYGSKHDDMINDKYPHAKVFDNIESLKKAGYTNCDTTDMVAADPKNVKIGIVKHGNTPAAAAMCPYKQTSTPAVASMCLCQHKIRTKHLKVHEMPIIHLGDQIDFHQHLGAHEIQELNELGSHLTNEQHNADFGQHFNYSFNDLVTSKYKIKY